MKTLTVDDQKRIRIPDAKPRTKFAYENNGDGTITLTEIRAKARAAFQRRSLLNYLTPRKDKAQPTSARPKSRLTKEDGFTVVVPRQPINERAIMELLSDFP
jgi:hypothetical protein